MKKRVKKSQAAMEFLSTYGWSLLIIAIVIITLVSFGITNTSFFLPRRIDFGPGIIVPDYNVAFFNNYGMNIATFNILIKNGLGTNMQNTVITIKECNNGEGKSSIPVNIGADKTVKIVIMCENINFVGQNEEISTATLTYNTVVNNNRLPHSRQATIIAYTQKMREFKNNNMGRQAWALEHGGSGKNDANRFVPCGEIPGCNNPDNDEKLINIFGGYIDSINGKIWSKEESTGNWAIIESGHWDPAEQRWNYNTEEYEYITDPNRGFPWRDDLTGTAFEYCNSKPGYKLPSTNDFIGLLECEKCLPPYGTYPPSGIPYGKWYWTDDASDEPAFATCIHFVEDTQLEMIAKCSKSQILSVRCIKDNP
ncbi:MAG: hypothetical protein ACMXYG_04930 [Candidatus Woesearchaeota archaeon]